MFKKASYILSDYYFFKADINGNSSAPDMSGTARFYPWLDGTMVEIELSGMPARNEPFAVHIHEDAFCEPEEHEDTPERCAATAKHLEDTITLPGVFSNNGYAYMATYTDRFIPQQAEGRTVIIHSSPDSFTSTDTFGNRIACGIIRRMEVGKSL